MIIKCSNNLLNIFYLYIFILFTFNSSFYYYISILYFYQTNYIVYGPGDAFILKY
jgi:hypothetical protein